MKALNPFKNLSHLGRTLYVTFPKPYEDWRLVSPSPIGEVNGLPNIRGALIASNGILCIVLSTAGGVFFAHHEWFIEDHDIVPKPFRPVPGQHATKRPAFVDDYV